MGLALGRCHLCAQDPARLGSLVHPAPPTQPPRCAHREPSVIQGRATARRVLRDFSAPPKHSPAWHALECALRATRAPLAPPTQHRYCALRGSFRWVQRLLAPTVPQAFSAPALVKARRSVAGIVLQDVMGQLQVRSMGHAVGPALQATRVPLGPPIQLLLRVQRGGTACPGLDHVLHVLLACTARGLAWFLPTAVGCAALGLLALPTLLPRTTLTPCVPRGRTALPDRRFAHHVQGAPLGLRQGSRRQHAVELARLGRSAPQGPRRPRKSRALPGPFAPAAPQWEPCALQGATPGRQRPPACHATRANLGVALV